MSGRTLKKASKQCLHFNRFSGGLPESPCIRINIRICGLWVKREQACGVVAPISGNFKLNVHCLTLNGELEGPRLVFSN